MNLNIVSLANRHAELSVAAEHAVTDGLRDRITKEVLRIEGRLATAKPRTTAERRAMLETVARAMEADGSQAEYIAAIRATL
ncbi:MAG: hypothetical protein KDJ29_20935 [Hyphomicrobiales bacterium]|nr:hypothetical protein [Hyphomicrobiales bacterium]